MTDPREGVPITRQDGPRPAPETVRGLCPRCGEELVSNSYYVAGRGYVIRWECWAALGPEPTCTYRRAL